jgi:hypothetical protein
MGNRTEETNFVTSVWRGEHPTEATLDAFSQGKLSPHDHHRITVHLSSVGGPQGHEGCKSCNQFYNALGR